MGQYHELWAFDPTGIEPAETIDHYRFGAGAKLGEQAGTWDGRGWNRDTQKHTRSKYPKGVRTAAPYASAVALMAMGRWAGRKLIVIGDYAEASDVPGFKEEAPLNAYYGQSGTYHNAEEGPQRVADVSEYGLKLLAEASGQTPSGKSGWDTDFAKPVDWTERVKRWASMPEGDEQVIASTAGEYLTLKEFGTPSNMAAPFLGAAWPVVIGLLACSDGRGGGDLDLEPAGRWAYTHVSMVPRSEATFLGLADITPWVLSHDKIVRWVMGDE